MLRPSLFHDPDRTLNITVGEVGYQLAEVAVVAPTVLVFDDDFAKIGLRNKVDAKVPGAYFTLSIGETESEDLVKFPDV